MNILISILNYHQHNLLINLIEKLTEQNLSGDKKIYIYIGDIQPNKNEKKMLEKYKNIYKNTEIHYLELDENLGYARGNNKIVKKALENNNYNYIIISNPDIDINNNNLIDELVSKIMKIDDCAIIAPKVITEQGRQQGPYNKQYPIIYILKYLFPIIWYPFWKYREYKIVKYRKTKKVWRVIGAFMLLDMKEFLNINMFDENTFLYWEEDILSYKLEKRKKHTYFEPSISVSHLHGSNGKSQISKYDMESMKYYFRFAGYNNTTIKFCEVSVKFYNKICSIIGKK